MKKLPYEIPEFLLALTEEEIKADDVQATGDFGDDDFFEGEEM
jgi:hypothetical protein